MSEPISCENCDLAFADYASMDAHHQSVHRASLSWSEVAALTAERDRLAEAYADASGQLTAARRSIEGLRTRMLAAEAERDRLREERDLAIAHDRQPYPTAEAYEGACRALEKHRERADK